MRQKTAETPEWQVAATPVPYAAAVAAMEARAAAVADGSAPELIWLLEHPPIITAGTSSRPEDLRQPGRFPVHPSGRGGRYTYHGPGQRVVYAVLDLDRRGRDLKAYVASLEGWVIDALAMLGVAAGRSAAGTGIWVGADGAERKIAAIGIRVRRWVAYHGVAINVSTDLDAYAAIIPCGITDRGVTRLVDLAPGAGMAVLDAALAATLPAFLARLVPRPVCRMKPLEGASNSG